LSSVILSEKIANHNVDKYSFKVLVAGAEPQGTVFESALVSKPAEDEDSFHRESDIDASAMSQSSKDSLIESLLKKTDEMTSNFIKLQMRLESMSDEHKEELVKVKEESYEKGVEAGKAKALKDGEKNVENGLSQFATSVSTLEKSAKEFEGALEGIKKELINAAIDIAKEVISVELNENSNKIATILSAELIKELQSASKIVLKVNPKDHGVLSEKVGSMKHIEVVSDSAVSQGGVIAISDAGNIDAQISKRFERVKRAALSE
jgi:flagellar assembly protein FliH